MSVSQRELKEALSAHSRKIGAKGGKNRWAGVPAAKRKQTMKAVAQARWGIEESDEPAEQLNDACERLNK